MLSLLQRDTAKEAGPAGEPNTTHPGGQGPLTVTRVPGLLKGGQSLQEAVLNNRHPNSKTQIGALPYTINKNDSKWIKDLSVLVKTKCPIRRQFPGCDTKRTSNNG